jgi:hypothetical protein
MKKSLLRFLSVTALLLVTVSMMGFSNAAQAANAWKTNLPISSILNNLDGGVLLLLPASDPACGSSGNQFNITANRNGQTAESVKTTLAIVWMAYSLGKTINIYVDNTLPGCPVQLVQINQE